MRAGFCPNCGNKMEGETQFCPGCGVRPAREQAAPEAEPQYEPPRRSAPRYVEPGFSKRINDPEIVAKTEKNNKAGKKLMLFLLPLPIIGFPIYALASREMEVKEALIIGAVISLVILLLSFRSKSKQSAKNTYEAVVIDKREDTTRTNGDDQTVYLTIVRTVDGKKKKIQETGHPERSAYEYLKVGDRFRYHPQLAFPYEKFDKTQDGFVYCACCAEKNILSEDRCCKCGVPLLK